MTIKVTGYQWKWSYDYLQEGFGFYSNLSTPLAQIENREPKGEHYLLEVDNPMVVPIGAKVRVLITAGDVIHSWSVPAFGVKQDAIPGLRARHVVQGGEARHLPRPVFGTVRQGARLHAGRGRGEVEGRLRGVGDGTEGRRSPRPPTIPTKVWTRSRPRGQGRDGLRGQLRGVPPGQRQGRAGRVPGARRLQDRQSVLRRADRAGAAPASPAPRCRRGSSCRTPTSPR